MSWFNEQLDQKKITSQNETLYTLADSSIPIKKKMQYISITVKPLISADLGKKN